LAGEAGIERHSEDFGQTLGRWGVGPGPYLVLPVLGASTLRDAVALPVDRRANPLQTVDSEGQRWALTGLQVVSVRAGLLGATRMLDQVALDRYTFVRDAHLARRRNDVYDGNPPEEADAPK
jgi:phospholipid-binding lipoprotein MlaA